MRGLTSHVLDTLHGRPAVGVAVTLFRLSQPDAEGWCMSAACIARQITNEQGRVMLAGELEAGEYELRFDLGAYFAACVPADTRAPDGLGFLGIVPVRFCQLDPQQHLHVPLVASPWSYATYKGGAPKSGGHR